MTLHWWNHWFWITKPVAVATQLIFLLAAVQTVPLPASTLDPQSHSSHHSRTPLATSWASGNDDAFENDKPTSVYVEQHRQTVVYEDGPVWSNSPDIEEPFYPTTASSDRLSNRDLPTENIPLTPKSISNEELHTKTYLPKSFEKVQEYGSPTEFTSEYFSDQSEKADEIVRNFDSIDKNDISQYPYKSNGELNLQEQITTFQEIHSSTQVNYISTTPKNIDYSIRLNNHLSFNTDSNQQSSIKRPPNYSVSEKVTNINDHPLTRSRKVSQRLVIRDLSNLSEPTFSSVVASHGSNSTDNENTSRPSPRASKAIGSFPHFSTSTSLDHKQEHIPNPGKVEENPKTVHIVENNENTTSKSPEHNNDSKSFVNPQVHYPNVAKANFNSSFSVNNSEKQNNEHENKQIGNRRTYLESDSSKLSPEMYNKSVQNMNNTARKLSNVNSEGINVSTSSSSIQNNLSNTSTISATETESKHTLSSESPVPFDSNISQRITTLSDTEETGNLTPARSHEFVGRSASLSHDTETTVEPSVAPVSRSRIAASPQDISHSGLDAASITGIALGIVVFAGLTGAVSFILYRRRYLNKPQTLNDKCSNPDSSGYIDDSTLRDNSEEMYSLDNDSFLNSLEAMTIQNYWTDNETCWRQNHP